VAQEGERVEKCENVSARQAESIKNAMWEDALELNGCQISATESKPISTPRK
jgi:hypothetical protein